MAEGVIGSDLIGVLGRTPRIWFVSEPGTPTGVLGYWGIVVLAGRHGRGERRKQWLADDLCGTTGGSYAWPDDMGWATGG